MMNVVVFVVATVFAAVVAGLLEGGRRRQRARHARLTREGEPVHATVERVGGVGRYGALQRCEASFVDANGCHRVARWVWPTALVHERDLRAGREIVLLHVPGSDIAGPPPDVEDGVSAWVGPGVFAFIVVIGGLLGLVTS
jgi:hypothetical protein